MRLLQVGVLVGAVASSAIAQQPGSATPGARRFVRPQLAVEVGVGLPSLLVHDGNGTHVQSSVAPILGVEASWPLAARLRWLAGIRASSAALDLTANGSSWKGGHTSEVGVRLGLERAVGARLAISGAGSGFFIGGPGDVAPFRDDAGLHWGSDIGIAWRFRGARPTSVFLTLESFLLGGKTVADPITSPSWVRRLVVGARRVM